MVTESITKVARKSRALENRENYQFHKSSLLTIFGLCAPLLPLGKQTPHTERINLVVAAAGREQTGNNNKNSDN